MNNHKSLRADPGFAQEIDDIKIERIKKGKDRKMKSSTRITAAIRRHLLWRDIKKDIINDELKDDKKGQVNVLEWIVIAFVTVLFIGIFIYAFGLFTDSFTNLGTSSTGVNMSEAGANTFGQMNNALSSGAATIGFVLLFATALSILINNFFIKEHPIAFIIHFFVALIAVVLSVPVSNAYASLLTGEPFSSNLITMKAASSVMLHLPTWVTVIGLTGAIILFVRAIRVRREFA